MTVQQVQASAVQARHAYRVASKLADFAGYLTTLRVADIRARTPSELAVDWIHTKVSRATVTVPDATWQQYLFAIKKLIPDIDKSTPGRSYRAGMVTMTAAGPRAPDLPDLPDEEVVAATVAEVARIAARSKLAAAVLAVMLLMVQGLRTPEAVATVARGLQRPPRHAQVAPPPRCVVREVVPFRLKNDMASEAVRAVTRHVVAPVPWWSTVEAVWATPLVRHPLVRQWLEETVTQIWHAAGVRDVRGLRRLAATNTWLTVTRDQTSSEALDTVRRVLGHVDGSASTARYVPDRVTAKDKAIGQRAAVRRNALLLRAAVRQQPDRQRGRTSVAV